MNVKRCDRCGRDYVRCADYGVRFGTWSQVSSTLDTVADPERTFSSYDLCENCAYAFMQWFNKELYRKGICVVKNKNGRFKFGQETKEETT